jgi:tetratricopeptide (TPR) repeat protein
MNLKSILPFFLILIVSLNCEKQSENKRKIKLATDQQSPDFTDNSTQSTVIKFDAQEKQSIAVLTFENQTGNRNLEWLCKGITDMLIRDFSQSRSLKVTTLQRIYDIFKQLDIQSPQDVDYKMVSKIGKEANVKAVMKGSFSNFKDSLAIAVQLYNVDSGNMIQQEKVSGKGMEQIFSMVDELTNKVKSNIKISLQDVEDQDLNIADISTKSLEAYRYYTEGIDLIYKSFLGDAIEKFEQAIKIDSTFAMAHYWASIIYLQLEKISEAQNSIAVALNLSENVSHKEKMKIERVHAEFNNDREKSLSLLKELVNAYPDDKELNFQLAVNHFFNKEINKAEELLNHTLLLDPEFVQAYNMQSIMFRDRGDYKNAIHSLNKYIELKPDEPTPRHNLAEIYEVLGDFTKAITSYKTAISLKPDFHFSILSLANVYSTLGKYKKAEEQYLSALKVLPSEELKARVYSGLAEVDLSRGKYKNAISNLEEASKYQSSKEGKASYIVMKADIYFRKEMYDSALVLASKALLFQDKNFVAYSLMGKTYLKINEIDSAKAIALTIDKTIFDSKLEIVRNIHTNLLRRIAFAEKRYDDAINLCQQIIGDNPEATSLYRALGLTYVEMNEPFKAIEWYQKYISKNPNDALINFHLAMAYDAANEKRKAAKSMRKFLNMWKNADEDIPEMIKAKEYLFPKI